MDIDKLSNCTKTILQNKKGYRYEALYGEGYRDIKEVCIHETFELANADIPDTLLTLYAELLSEDEIALFNRITDCDCDTDDIDDSEIDAFGDICVRIAKTATGLDTPQCIWLCASPQDIIDSYIISDEEIANFDTSCVDEYDIPDNVCVLSDIDTDGALLAFAL